MSKTPFSKQCEILGNFAIAYGDDDTLDEGWKGFIKNNDVVLPLCSLIWLGLAKPTRERGERYVTETWNDFCRVLGINSDKRYADLKDVFDESRRVAEELDE